MPNTRSVPLLSCLLAAASLLLAPTGCTTFRSDDEPATSAETRFVVVRHAEKQSGNGVDADDPGLTDAGLQRARRLARSSEMASVSAVYSTPYRRTRDTASPSALARGLDIIEYDPHRPATEFVGSLRAMHPAGDTVLVVGHSNTVPAIVAALCGCDVPAMEEDEYEHRYIIDVDATGQARVADHPLP